MAKKQLKIYKQLRVKIIRRIRLKFKDNDLPHSTGHKELAKPFVIL